MKFKKAFLVQNAINNSLLDRVDIPSRPVEDVRLIPTASKEMIDHGYLGDIYRDKPSIGIKRVGEECFLIALLQGFILKDPVLEKAFWEEAYVGGPSAEIGIFLHAYREAQMNGKKVCDANITLLRHALMRVGHDSTWSRGQHDPYEALTVLLRDPGLAARLENMGFYSKERMIRYSWSDTHEEIASFLDKISSWGDVTVSPVGLSPNLTIDQLLFQTMNAEKDEVITNDPITHESVHYHRSLRQFLTAPEYLNVIYKRYDYVSRSRDDGSAYRLSTDVRVEETMTLASKLVGDGKKAEYELVSLEIHSAKTMHDGHHYTYVKELDEKGGTQWYCLNDAIKTPISFVEILEKDAKNIYMLKFKKQ